MVIEFRCARGSRRSTARWLPRLGLTISYAISGIAINHVDDVTTTKASENARSRIARSRRATDEAAAKLVADAACKGKADASSVG